MKGWFPRILLLTVILQSTVYAIRPMVSYKAIEIGADNFQIGVVAAAYASLSFIVAIPIGRWVDSWGEPRFIVGGSIVISSVSLALVTVDSLVPLALTQAALGLGHIMSVVGTQTMIANLGDPAQRDGRFGIFTVVVSLGQLGGPAMAGLVAGRSSAPGSGDGAALNSSVVFGVAAAVSVVATLIALTLLARGGRAQGAAPPTTAGASPDPVSDEAALAPSSFQALDRVLRIPSMPHAMVASLTVLTAVDLITVYLPAYGAAKGIDVETVGLLLAVRAGGSMTSRLLMLPLVRTFGRRQVLVGGIAIPAMALAALPSTTAPSLLLVLMAIAGFGLGLGQPISLAWVADQAPHGVRGTALGVRLMGNRLGQVVLPAVVGGIAGAQGLVAVFVSLSALLAVSAGLVMAASF